MGSNFRVSSNLNGTIIGGTIVFVLKPMAAFLDRKTVNICVGAAMMAVLVVAGYASYKQYERHSRITAEVAILEEEKERVRKENESLKERIHYFATENFREQESKERLNMRKDNEYVVDIERVPSSLPEAATEPVVNPQMNMNTPNYKKWWEKIF